VTVIRTAHPNELPALVEHPGDHDRNTATGTYLTDLLAKGCTRPDWCLVAEQDGTVTGSAVLWALPGNDTPSDLVLLETPWDDPDLTTGLAVLQHAFTTAKALGAGELGHVIDSPAQPPQFQRHPERRADLLHRAGFTQARDGRRFQWLAGADLPTDDPRLQFRSLADLGPEPFVELLAVLLTDTADARLAADVQEHGARKAAEVLFDDCTQLHHEPHWWEIGYDPDGSPAVISLPSHNPSVPVIAFVGVAPAHRGKGYATSVVARGTRILADAGATEIRGDCDVANTAMYKAFQRAGYHNFANRLEFLRTL
jgi:RimJ/RimL family protein N-acetyltransferase